MKKLLIFLAIILAIVTTQVFFASKKSPSQPLLPESTSPPVAVVKNNEVDYKAGFAIFTNGTFRVFTAPMYQNRSADVFIEATKPNIVHVKKAGIKWHDFFKTLPMELTKTCLTTGTKEKFCSSGKEKLYFYLNGVETPSLLDLEIKNGDRILISYGKNNPEEIQKQFQKAPNF